MSPAVRLPEPGLAAVLTAVVAVLSAVPAWQFVHWQWIAFSVAAPVVLGLGAPVHRAAGAALRRGRVGVEALVAAGPLAALGWSAYALLTGPAGDPGFTQSLTDRTLALDAAAALTVVALAGLPTPATRGPATRDRKPATRGTPRESPVSRPRVARSATGGMSPASPCGVPRWPCWASGSGRAPGPAPGRGPSQGRWPC